MTASAIMASAGLGTPETYLDPQRAARVREGDRAPASASTRARPVLALNHFALKGPWNASSESITADAAGASISGAVQAAKVYLVLTSAGNVPRQARVLLDGQPSPAPMPAPTSRTASSPSPGSASTR